jgi:hypothetical protein
VYTPLQGDVTTNYRSVSNKRSLFVLRGLVFDSLFIKRCFKYCFLFQNAAKCVYFNIALKSPEVIYPCTLSACVRLRTSGERRRKFALMLHGYTSQILCTPPASKS